MKRFPKHHDQFVTRLVDIIKQMDCRKDSLFECGVGEAIVFVLSNKLKMPSFSGVELSGALT